jgi:hypothetical protein
VHTSGYRALPSIWGRITIFARRWHVPSASLPPVPGGGVRVTGTWGGIGVVESRFGPEDSGRVVVPSGNGNFRDGGCRERIDGGER